MDWHLEGKPYEVQTEALARANGKKGFAYFLEQGLGKTPVYLNEITDLYWKDEIQGAVLVMPRSLLLNWKDEAEKFGFKGNVYAWPDVQDIDYTKLWVIVINFEALISKRGGAFMDGVTTTHAKHAYFGVDESSKMGNHRSQRTLEILRHGCQYKYRRVASGTPIRKSPGDLWAQLRLIDAVTMRFYPFRGKFCQMGGYMGKQIVGVRNEDKLQTVLDEFALVALKEDWAKHIPPKIYATRTLEMSKEQQKHYRAMERDFYTMIEGEDIEAQLVLTQMVRLQQITSGFVRDENGKDHLLAASVRDIPKIAATLDIVDEARGKVIIFCTSTTSIANLVEALGNNKPAVIRGGMTDAARKQARDDFNKNPACRTMICHIESGGIGLTLLGEQETGGDGDDACSTTIYFENSFSLEARKQSEDRNHRHGQLFNVTYYDFASSSIEKKTVLALQKKQQIVDLIMNPVIWRKAA